MATDEPVELLPCAICARTFKPQSLEKHSKICELTAAKKRKPFDSAKQRIQGTELAEFLPKETTTKRKSYQTEERGTDDKTSWKQTHDEFLRAIRAARGETMETSNQRSLVPSGNVTLGVPTRPNEKGMCPTCNRQFSIKSYERHVAWCKERATRVPISAATNIAKERLEARMKYRAPALKNRRPTNREKYSPSSAHNLTIAGSKNNNNRSTSHHRAKETVSTPNCNDINEANEYSTGSTKKSLNTRRSGLSGEGISSGPMKSRLSDRSNRPGCEIVTGRSTVCSSPRESSSRISNKLRWPRDSRISDPANVREEIEERTEENNSPKLKNRRYRSLSIVQVRSNGNPRINDTTINDEVTGMKVQPAYLRKKIKNEAIEENEFVTWKKIGETKSHDFLKFNSIQGSSVGNPIENEKLNDEGLLEFENVSWTSRIEKLDQTYLIKESMEADLDFPNFSPRRLNHQTQEIQLNSVGKTRENMVSENSEIVESSVESDFRKVRNHENDFGRNLVLSSPLMERSKLEPLDLGDEEIEEDSQSSGTLESEKLALGRSSRNVVTKASPKYRSREASSDKPGITGSEVLVEINDVIFQPIVKKTKITSTFDSSPTKRAKLLKTFSGTISTKRIESRVENDSIANKTSRVNARHEKMDFHGEMNFPGDIDLINDNKRSEIEISKSLRNTRSHREPLERHRIVEKSESNENPSLITNDPWDFGFSIKNRQESANRKKSSEITNEPRDVGFSTKNRRDSGNHEKSPEIDENPGTDLEKLPRRKEKYHVSPIPSNFESRQTSNSSKLPENRISPEVNSDDAASPKMAEQPAMVVDSNIDSCEVKENPQNSSDDDFSQDLIFQTKTEDFIEIPRSLEEREDKNDDKNDEENEKLDNDFQSSVKSKRDGKTNYRRCGTYVIDSKVNSTRELEKRPNSGDFSAIKFISHETKNGKSDKSYSSPEEKMAIETEKKTKRLEATKRTKIPSYENGRDLSEKFINEKFNYESDEAPVDENCLKYFDSDGSTNINEKLSFERERTNFHEKSFSDSCVVQFANDFSEEKETPKIRNVPAREMKTKNEHLIVETFSKFDDKLKSPNSLQTGQKPSAKSSLKPKSSFSRNKNCEVQNNLERDKKMIEKDCSLPRPEKPEVQNSLEIRRKLRKKMKLLRGSTDNLITSVETLADTTANKESSSKISFDTRSIGEIEQETICVIDLGNVRNATSASKISCGFLPEIPINRIISKNGDAKMVKKFEPRSEGASFYPWKKSSTVSNVRLINLDPPRIHQAPIVQSKKTAYSGILPRILHSTGNEKRRISDGDSRAAWSNYVRRHPDFNLVLKRRTGGCADYDPFLIAERQMNDLLLSDTCSERSLTDSSSNYHHRRGSPLSPSLPNYPLSHSSAFVKYSDTIVAPAGGKKPGRFVENKRVSLLAPPAEFEDFSSDSTETNSISREIMKMPGDESSHRFSRDSDCREMNDETRRKNLGRDGILGRRVIIDKSRALGKPEIDNGNKTSMRLLLENSSPSSSGKVRKMFEKRDAKVTRSNSVKTRSQPKRNNDERKANSSGSDGRTDKINGIRNIRNNNYPSLSGSNVSLSSIVSSDAELRNKRSNSIGLGELATSCDDDPSAMYPSLTYLIKNDSLSVTSPTRTDQSSRNGQNSDEEFSSPDSYKRHHEHGKLSADSAYSSLNRKYLNHGRNANESVGRQDEDSPQHNRREMDNGAAIARSKMSKYCHECGSKFPETAKFCCECGVRRLVL